MPEPRTHCPYCLGRNLLLRRLGGRDLTRCAGCGAVLQLDAAFVEEWEGYTQGDVIGRHEERFGATPNFQAFDLFRPYLIGHSLLEIGPGTGYFLAAAQARGFKVAGVEINARQRAFIQETWGIPTEGQPLEVQAFPENHFDNVVSFNCIEHIVDPDAHLAAMVRVVRPGGRILLTTHHARSLAARLTGAWWPMYGVPDHVALATRESLLHLGQRHGLRMIRCWTGEFPLETPATLLVAFRDWRRSSRSPSGCASLAEKHFDRAPAPTQARALMRHPLFAPVAWTISALGLANSLRVVFERPKP
jgi:SAM-dependent methyltransferase